MATRITSAPTPEEKRPSPSTHFAKSSRIFLLIGEKVFLVMIVLHVIGLLLTFADKTLPAQESLVRPFLSLQNIAQSIFWYALFRQAHTACVKLAGPEGPDLRGLSLVFRRIAFALFVMFIVGLLFSLAAAALSHTALQAIDVSTRLPSFPPPEAWRESFSLESGSTSSLRIDLVPPLFSMLFWFISFPMEHAALIQEEQSYTV